MAEAIVRGAMAARPPVVGSAFVVDPSAERRQLFSGAEFAGFVEGVTADGGDAARWLAAQDQVLLAVKPQSLDAAAATIRPAFATSAGPRPRVAISILAGASTERVRKALGGEAAVVRVMPNLAARIGRGVAAVAAGSGCRPGDETVAVRLFEACGEVVRIDESLMDAFTALAGSGPAYVFFLAEAMERAAMEMGFDAATAQRVVKGVVAGAGELLAASSDSPADLRAAVTSRGGTTAAALDVLEREKVAEAIRRALLAARDRGAELGRG